MGGAARSAAHRSGLSSAARIVGVFVESGMTMDTLRSGSGHFLSRPWIAIVTALALAHALALALALALAFSALLLALLWPAAAEAAPVADRDARAVRAVVEAQLQAFAAGDGERAFSYASPAIRSQFGDAGTFMAMVKAGYPMMLRPSVNSFFLPERASSAVVRIVQKVQLKDGQGRRWLATYELLQDDDAWRINGCTVAADDGKSSI